MIIMRIRFIVLIAVAMSVGLNCEPFAVQIDSMLDRCCLFGSTHAKVSLACGNYNFNMTDEISSNLHSLCQSNIDFCCEKHQRMLECDKGKRSALLNEACHNKSETFQLCCRACEIGQQISKIDGKCNQQILNPVDKVRNECCVNFKYPQPYETETLPFSSEDDDETDLNSEMVGSQEKSDCERGYSFDNDGNCVAEVSRPVEINLCTNGFYVNEAEKCVDIDECEDKNLCSSSQECFNTHGSYECRCAIGYELDVTREDCEDINECKTETPCDITEICVNTPGSHYCKEKLCGVGLSLNQFTGECEDIDECNSGAYCGRFGYCKNTYASYECICQKGFHFKNSYVGCEDINECDSGSRCEITKTCINLEGSYKCDQKTCDHGFKLNNYSGNCDDIDECLMKPCGLLQKCINSIGSYRCDCTYGYRKDPNHMKFCRDVDECLEQPGICDQLCVNIWGSYRCSCFRGFLLNHDNRTCIDQNECKVSGKFPCPGTCENTIGSFRCGCPEGLKLEGKLHCSDINECKDSNACNGIDEVCINTYGSHSCMKKSCDHGYQYFDEVCHLKDLSLCGGGIKKDHGTCRVPRVYAFVFGSLMANCSIPDGGRGIFMFNNYHKKDYVPKINSVKVISSGGNVVEANDSFFRLELLNGSFKVKLMKAIDGPQDIEIDVWLHVRGQFRTLGHIQGYRVLMAVSKHSYM